MVGRGGARRLRRQGERGGERGGSFCILSLTTGGSALKPSAEKGNGYDARIKRGGGREGEEKRRLIPRQFQKGGKRLGVPAVGRGRRGRASLAARGGKEKEKESSEERRKGERGRTSRTRRKRGEEKKRRRTSSLPTMAKDKKPEKEERGERVNEKRVID